MIFDYVKKHATNYPEKLFLVDKSNSYTYENFLIEAYRIANYLHSKKLKRGDTIILLFPNCAQLLTSYCASTLLGLTPCFVNDNTPSQQLELIFKQTNAKYIFTLNSYDYFNRTIFYPSLDQYISSNNQFIDQFSDNIVMFSSGTTGMPKGVVVNKSNVVFSAKSMANWANFTKDDIELIGLKLSHSFALGQFHTTAYVGGTVYIEPNITNIIDFLTNIYIYNITGISLTPGMVQILVSKYEELLTKYLINLNRIVLNSAPMPPPLTRKILKLLVNTQIYTYYGLVEASRTTSIHLNQNLDKLDSVGSPPPGISIRISKINQNTNIKYQTGEICIKGKNVATTYINGNKITCDDGWLYTGDIGFIDNEGYLYITGRVDDLINSDGMKISPFEVESAIKNILKINEVVVFGVYDNITSQRVIAILARDNDTQDLSSLEIRRALVGVIEPFKIPKEIVFVKNIPKNEFGKISRKKIAEYYMANSLQIIPE